MVAAGAAFVVTNTSVAIGDVVVVAIQSGSNGGNTIATVADVAAASKLVTEIAGPAKLVETLILYGQIATNAEHQREVAARFPGLIKSVRRSIGLPRTFSISRTSCMSSRVTKVNASPVSSTRPVRPIRCV